MEKLLVLIVGVGGIASFASGASRGLPGASSVSFTNSGIRISPAAEKAAWDAAHDIYRAYGLITVPIKRVTLEGS